MAMRIFIMLPGLPVGGMERAAVTLANALSGRGHEVTVASYGKGDEQLAVELADGVRYLRKGLKPHRIMRHFPYIRHKFYDDGMWETRTSPERLYKFYVGSEKYDVEIAFFRGLAIKTLSANRKKDIGHPRRLAWVHTDFTKATGWNYNFQNLEAVSKAYSSYDHVICVSEQAKKGFIETVGDTGNLVTIYNLLPVDEIIAKAAELPAVNVPKHKFNIVLVGRLTDGVKGQCRLIEAVSALQSEGLDIGLTLVGDGPDRLLIGNHIKANNADGYVYMTGNQPNPYPYIRQADLLVCASYYEGYNLTVAEALILGTPVLSTRCTGPVEILDNGKYGMIVENSTEDLIAGLRNILALPERLAHYAALATHRHDFFNPDNILSQIENLIK